MSEDDATCRSPRRSSRRRAGGRGSIRRPTRCRRRCCPLVDRDGLTKPVLQIIAEEAIESGIEEICVVSAPGDEAVYRDHFRNYAANLRSAFKGVDWAEEQARRLVDLEQRLRFAVQPEPQGYGHAVWCAREFVAGEPFLLLAGRPPLPLGRSPALRPAVDRPGRGRGLRRLGRPGDPRAPDPPVRHAHGSPAGSASWKGLAQPREETEFALRYYNTLTTWVRIDGLLQTLQLTREDLTRAPEKVAASIRTLAARVPTYVTIKDVKRRWGHGQEDVFPVAQFEKLWGDLTSLARPPLRLPRGPPATRTAAQGRGPARRLGDRRQPRPRRNPLRAAFPRSTVEWRAHRTED